MQKKYFLPLIGSTILFCAWYFTLFQYAQQYLNHYQKKMRLDKKNCLHINNLSRSCLIEKESLATLHTQYQCSIDETKKCTNNQSAMEYITELLEKHNLTLDYYKQTKKEHKEWFSRFNDSLSFHGPVVEVLLFFEKLTAAPIIITPTSIELIINNENHAQVTTTLSWLICK